MWSDFNFNFINELSMSSIYYTYIQTYSTYYALYKALLGICF